MVDPAPTPSAIARGKRILVVGINFEPEPTGIGPYTTGLAEHLATSGAEVTVITGVPHYPAWRLHPDHRFTWRRQATHDSIRITRVRHFIPSTQNAVSRGIYEASFLLQATTTRTGGAKDLVIGITPSLGGALAGRFIARRLGCPLVVVVQDLMAKAADQSGIVGGSAVAGVTRCIERSSLLNAAAVGIVSEQFRRPVEELGVQSGRIRHLANWSIDRAERQERRLVRRRHGWDDMLVALHSGNMGNKQDLGNVVEAARLAESRKDVLFVLLGDGSQRDVLAHQARDLKNLRFLPPAAESEYADLLAASDVLLLNERPTVTDMSLPSKLTSYFRAGRPVLAAATHGGAAARELQQAGAGVIVPPGDPAALLHALSRLQLDPTGRRKMGMCGRRYAATRLSRARTMNELDKLLRMALGPDATDLAQAAGG